ncbi:MAG: hypothetical protein AAB906_00650 [Patescibacteria group bacterium]
MDEQIKLIKTILIVNILSLIVIIVLFGVQIFQIAGGKMNLGILSNKEAATENDKTDNGENDVPGNQDNPDSNNNLWNGAQQNEMPDISAGQQNLQPPTQDGNAVFQKKCGDNTCDELEKNTGICPKDCSK